MIAYVITWSLIFFPLAPIIIDQLLVLAVRNDLDRNDSINTISHAVFRYRS